MIWIVDTCVVLDVLENDPDHGLASAEFLQARLGEGLGISPITMVELAPAFGGDLAVQKHFLDLAGINYLQPWTSADTEAAHAGWQMHILARSSGHQAKRPIADILIGAFAQNRRGLITRNGRDFRAGFPDLVILEP